jgi:hypothetical protein
MCSVLNSVFTKAVFQFSSYRTRGQSAANSSGESDRPAVVSTLGNRPNLEDRNDPQQIDRHQM